MMVSEGSGPDSTWLSAPALGLSLDLGEEDLLPASGDHVDVVRLYLRV
jgi:hypothetical protein